MEFALSLAKPLMTSMIHPQGHTKDSLMIRTAAIAIVALATSSACTLHRWDAEAHRKALQDQQKLPEDDRQASPRDAQIRLFQPKARVYFDLKKNRSQRNELDVFDNGSLVPTISLLEFYWPKPFPVSLGNKSWSWGPSLGFGLSSPADDAPAGDTETPAASSNAPVLLFTLGLQAEFPISEVRTTDGKPATAEAQMAKATKLGIELGLAEGFSADESFSDINDAAIYFGFTIKF
jgi:hypothetical protein